MEHKHDPANGVYGDCLRACVASMLEAPLSLVPHFHFDGCEDDTEIRARLDDYLDSYHSLTSWVVAWHESVSLDVILRNMMANNPNRNYVLIGGTAAGDPHAAIYRNDELLHDPSAWGTGGIIGPWGGVTSILTFITVEACYGG